MGTDKRHLVPKALNGRSLMEHSADLLAALCGHLRILVSCDTEADLPPAFIPIVDRLPGQGPLPAINDGLRELQTPFALILPVDMPCLEKSRLRAWMQSFEAMVDRHAQFSLDENQRPTFPLLLRKEFRTSLAVELEGGQVRLFQGLRAAGAVALAPDRQGAEGCSLNPFLNLNRPADLERLESDISSSQP
jgi:molybdopterin-guanine dinucleotide biosynthesis protein A